MLSTVVALAVGSFVFAEAPRDIGRRIWLNESNGSEQGLVHWNKGEAFASMGIGHFIWYPAGQKGRYEETFPRLVEFMKARGARPPAWLKSGPCPWPDREAFLAQANGRRARQLRRFLRRTVGLQARFMTERLRTVRSMLVMAGVGERFDALAQSPAGLYALTDYLDFKGSGFSPTERYNGKGWGLLQVLENMRGDGWGKAGVQDFSRAAARVLRSRALNSPDAEQELRWLAGWKRRVRTYR
ncbi:MAG: hypothetical protein WC728_02170 [Elusimicrobiota bacterium]